MVKLSRYLKGSHKLIFYLQFFLKLLELEHDLLRRLLEGSYGNRDKEFGDKEKDKDKEKDPAAASAQSHDDFDKCFLDIVDSPLTYFIKTCESILKEKSVNKLLITLDILENLNMLLPRYRVVLKQNEQFNYLLDFQQQVTTACRKSISDYKEYVMTDSDGMKHKQQDGTIYTLTIEVGPPRLVFTDFYSFSHSWVLFLCFSSDIKLAEASL